VARQAELEQLRDGGEPLLAVEELLHLSLNPVLHAEIVVPLAMASLCVGARLWTA
jgi:hypothetical protein